MTFDEAKAIVQLMGWHVIDRTDVDGYDSYIDVWTRAAENGDPAGDCVFDCRIYDTPEEAQNRFIEWVEVHGCAPGHDNKRAGFIKY